MPNLEVNSVYEEIFFTKKRYIKLYGGRGGAKSFTVAQRFIIGARGKGYFRGVLMREVLGDIRQSQFQEIKDILEDSGLINEFHIRENTMEFQHKVSGNKIISKGFKKSAGNQTAKVKSIKDPTHIWIEEEDEVSEDDFVKADTSVRTTKAAQVQIIGTFNPEAEIDDPNNWIYRKFFTAKRDDTLIIHTTYKDNIANLQQSYIDTLERLKEEDPAYYDVYVLGLWGNKKIQSPFATQYKKSKHESDKAVKDERKQLLIGIDFNLNPFAINFAHMWRDEYGEHFHVFDEASIPHGSIPAMIELIKDRYGNQLHNCYLTGDAMGHRGEISQRDNASLYLQLQRGLGLKDMQVRTPRANPTHENSRADVNFVLYHFPDFKINHVNCPNTCRDMRTVQVDAFGAIIKKNRNDLDQRADNFDCFTGETLVSCFDGQKRIDKVKIGEFVLTPNGYKEVLDSWSSIAEVYEFTFSDNSKINCTKDHKFYAHKFGWCEIFSIFNERKKICKIRSVTMEEITGNIQSKNIITSQGKGKIIHGAFIGKCGMTHMEKFQKVMRFTTRMGMLLIIPLKTLLSLKKGSIQVTTLKNGLKQTQKDLKDLPKQVGNSLKSGINPQEEENGIKNMLGYLDLANENTKKCNVIIAPQNFYHKGQLRNFVPITASRHQEGRPEVTQLKKTVKSVEQNLPHKNINKEDFALEYVNQHQTLTVKKARRVGVMRVYDITVKDSHCFYANNILVHNCIRYFVNTFLRKWIDTNMKIKK